MNVSWEDAKDLYVIWLSRKDRPALPAAVRIGSEYAARTRNHDDVLRRRRPHSGARPITTAVPGVGRAHRIQNRQANDAGRELCGQRIRPPRHARQRLGMGRGLLAGRLHRKASDPTARRQLDGNCDGRVVARGIVGGFPGRTSFGRPVPGATGPTGSIPTACASRKQLIGATLCVGGEESVATCLRLVLSPESAFSLSKDNPTGGLRWLRLYARFGEKAWLPAAFVNFERYQAKFRLGYDF